MQMQAPVCVSSMGFCVCDAASQGTYWEPGFFFKEQQIVASVCVDLGIRRLVVGVTQVSL